MSALDPTSEEMQDLVSIVLPRVIVDAMNNPAGEFYNDEIADAAFSVALCDNKMGKHMNNENTIFVEIPVYIAQHIAEWKDCYAPMLREVAKSCSDALYINKIVDGE